MVERQYEAMKRERMRQLDEPNQAKPIIRPDDDISAVPQPTNTANSATEAIQPSEQEVSEFKKKRFIERFVRDEV